MSMYNATELEYRYRRLIKSIITYVSFGIVQVNT